jgi:arginase
MRLVDGVDALREDLPASVTREVAVPLEAGDEQSTGVARFSSLQLVRERLTDILDDLDGIPVVIGGDCAVSEAAITRAARTPGPDLAVVWFDAHPDLNTPESSPSGAYSGMVLRTLIESGAVSADRVVLAGTRCWDPGEESFAQDASIRGLDVDELATPEALVDAVAGTGAGRVYLHIDLDVLDPGSFGSLLDPEPFGLEPARLTAAIRALRAEFAVAGVTIAAYAPSSPEGAVEDAPTLLRIIGSLSG